MEHLWQDAEAPERAASEPALLVDVAGFEGPLDLLLHLARNQKVDLARISILALAEQYLAFVERVRVLRLELAADYLVMAAWLAFLKSRLLIPKQPGEDGVSGEEMAAVLQFRLKRLEAMRDAAARLVNRNRLGRDVFARGLPELVIVEQPQRIFGEPLRPAHRLRVAAAAAGDHQRHDRQAGRLVAEAGARSPDPHVRRAHRLDGARQLPDPLPGQRGGAGDGDRQLVRGDAGDGARRRDRDAPGRRPSRRSTCAAVHRS